MQWPYAVIPITIGSGGSAPARLPMRGRHIRHQRISLSAAHTQLHRTVVAIDHLGAPPQMPATRDAPAIVLHHPQEITGRSVRAVLRPRSLHHLAGLHLHLALPFTTFVAHRVLLAAEPGHSETSTTRG